MAIADTSAAAKRRPWFLRFARGLIRFLASCLTVLLWLWAVGALYFIEYLPGFVAVTLAGALAFGTIVALFRLPDRRRTWRAVLVVVAAVAIAWAFVQPSNDRNWTEDQARLSSGIITNSSIAMQDIRRVVLDSAGEIDDVHHFDRTYELDGLKKIWFGVEYFTQMRSFAHTFVTFQFDGKVDNKYLTFSIEIRREEGESFGLLSGFYRRYELMYVVSEEREMIENRLKTSQDKFYLYPIRTTAESRRALLIDMVERMNHLKDHPEFYNSVSSNCTNNIVRHLNRVASKRVSPYHLKVIFPGYSDRVAYKLGLIDTDLSFDDARARFRVDVRGRQLVGKPDFSSQIRQVP